MDFTGVIEARDFALNDTLRLARLEKGNEIRKIGWLRRQTHYYASLWASFDSRFSRTVVRRRQFINFSTSYKRLRHQAGVFFPLTKLVKVFQRHLRSRQNFFRPFSVLHFSKRRVRFLVRLLRLRRRYRSYRKHSLRIFRRTRRQYLRRFSRKFLGRPAIGQGIF